MILMAVPIAITESRHKPNIAVTWMPGLPGN